MKENVKNVTSMIIAEAEKGKLLDELLRDTLPLEPVQGLILSKLKDKPVDWLGAEIGASHAGIYKIISGKSRPERNTLLCIAFALRMDINETQQLLKSGRRSLLTGSDRRDVAIIYGLSNGLSLDEMDEALEQLGFGLLRLEKYHK